MLSKNSSHVICSAKCLSSYSISQQQQQQLKQRQFARIYNLHTLGCSKCQFNFYFMNSLCLIYQCFSRETVDNALEMWHSMSLIIRESYNNINTLHWLTFERGINAHSRYSRNWFHYHFFCFSFIYMTLPIKSFYIHISYLSTRYRRRVEEKKNTQMY